MRCAMYSMLGSLSFGRGSGENLLSSLKSAIREHFSEVFGDRKIGVLGALDDGRRKP